MKAGRILATMVALGLFTSGAAFAQEAECRHVNGHEYKNTITEQAIYTDGEKHIIIMNGAEGEYCIDCGAPDWEDVYENEIIEGEHTFTLNICRECGFEREVILPDTCTHENKLTEDLIDRETVSFNNETHTQTWNGFMGYHCRDCGYSWKVEYENELVEEKHFMWDELCEYCDYVKEFVDQETCAHAKANITENYRSDRTGIVSYTEDTHIVRYQNYRYVYCGDCGYYAIEESNTSEAEEGHIFMDGGEKCYFCDYVKGDIVSPTQEPDNNPTTEPTEEPTEVPTDAPTEEPTEEPNEEPTEEPTESPIEKPTAAPDKDDDDVPKTGDTSMVTGMYVLLAMAAALVYLLVKRHKAK